MKGDGLSWWSRIPYLFWPLAGALIGFGLVAWGHPIAGFLFLLAVMLFPIIASGVWR